MRRRILIYRKIKNVDYLSMFLDVADSVESSVVGVDMLCSA